MAEDTDGSPGFSDSGPGFWSVLQHLQHTSQLCDIQLCVSHPDDPLASDAIPAHKVVLVACSSFFRAALETSELLDVYNFVGITRDNLQVVVDYMYRRLTLQELMSNSEAAIAAQSIQVVAHKEGDVRPGSLVPGSEEGVDLPDTVKAEDLMNRLVPDSEEGKEPGNRVCSPHSLHHTGEGDEQHLDHPQTDQYTHTESTVMDKESVSKFTEKKDFMNDSGNVPDSAKQRLDHSETTGTKVTEKTKHCVASQSLKQTSIASKGKLKNVFRNTKDMSRRDVAMSEQRLPGSSNMQVETMRTSLGRSSQRRRKNMNYRLLAEGIDLTDEEQDEGSVSVLSDVSVGDVEHSTDTCKDPDFSATIGQPRRKRGRPPKAPEAREVTVLSDTAEAVGYTVITRTLATGFQGNTEGVGGNNDPIGGTGNHSNTEAEGDHNNPTVGNDTLEQLEQTDQPLADNTAYDDNAATEDVVLDGAKRRVGSLQCSNCQRGFNTESALTQHRKLVHGVQVLYGCTTCGQELDSIRQLEKHKKDVHQMWLHTCGTCGTNFKTRDGLKLHQQKKHSGEKPTYSCTVCLKAFYLKGELKNHLQYHSAERAHQCDQCTRSFKSKSILVRHVNTYHSNERKFQCDVCGAMFKTRNDCKAHRLKHFRNKNPLSGERKHGKRLPERQQYPCTHCGKVFKKRSHQLVHENLQHRQKNDGTAYLCTMCNKVFSIRHYLMQHIKNCHTDRRFTCSQCSQKFSQRGDLKKHETIPGRCKGSVAEPKPFSCPYCKRGFSLKGNLSKHLQHPERCKHHPSNPSNPEVIVVLQQEAEGDGEVGAQGETPGEPVLVVPNGEQADIQGLDAASVQHEEGTSGLYSLNKQGNLELQGLVDGKVLPISMSAVNGQYQFHLEDGHLEDGQVVTYAVHTDGEEQGVTAAVHDRQLSDGQVVTYSVGDNGDGQVQDGQVVTYQVVTEGDGAETTTQAQDGHVQLTGGEVLTYQIPAQDNDHTISTNVQAVMGADLADNTQIIHLFEDGTVSHTHPADSQVMEVIEGHSEVIINQGHPEVIHHQGNVDVIQGEGQLQTQGLPEVIQVQGHSEIFHGQGHSEIIQGQDHLKVTQGQTEVIEGGFVEVIAGQEVREEVVTEMGMDIQTIDNLTENCPDVTQGQDGETSMGVEVPVVLETNAMDGMRQEVVHVIHDLTDVTQEVVTDDMTQLSQDVVYLEHSEDVVTEQLIQ